MSNLDTRPHEGSPAQYKAEKVSRTSLFKEVSNYYIARAGPAQPSPESRSILEPTQSTDKWVTRAISRVQADPLSLMY